MQSTRRRALALSTLAALGLAAALPQAAQAQTTVEGTYTTTSNDDNAALVLSSGGNQSSGPSVTPAKDAGNSYLFTGGTYSSTQTIGLRTRGVTATINSGAFTGDSSSLYLVDSTVTINGGTFTLTNASSNNVQSYGTNLSVYGGTFVTPSSGLGFFIGDSTDTFYGDFAPQTITNTGAGDLSGTFTGTLANGGPRQTFSYLIGQGGTLRLVNPNASTPAPEPSGVAAFAFTGLGAAALMLRARRRTASAAA